MREAVGVSRKVLSRFRQLCNTKPLREGRHRGQNAVLRDATEAELNEARDTAQAIIEGYLRHLDTVGGAGSP
jgi:hypothetical protein